MHIRHFSDADAAELSALIRQTLKVTNSKDYPPAMIEDLVKTHTEDYLKQRAAQTHFYVAEDQSRILGCGAIGPWDGREDECCLYSIFVHPDWQGRGLGRFIIERLEQDPYCLRAARIEVPASLTAVPFYLKLGYQYKAGMKEPDERLLVSLEKYR